MSATNAPFGFMPQRHPSGLVRSSVYAMTPTDVAAVKKYALVKIAADGGVTAAAAAEDIIGVFAGVEYTDSEGRRIKRPDWPTGGVAGAREIEAHVWDDPLTIFMVQADGPVDAIDVGNQADVTNPTAGSNMTGLSNATLSATNVIAAGQGQFRILGIEGSVDNTAGDAFTKVLVTIARHQFVANKVTL